MRSRYAIAAVVCCVAVTVGVGAFVLVPRRLGRDRAQQLILERWFSGDTKVVGLYRIPREVVLTEVRSVFNGRPEKWRESFDKEYAFARALGATGLLTLVRAPEKDVAAHKLHPPGEQVDDADQRSTAFRVDVPASVQLHVAEEAAAPGKTPARHPILARRTFSGLSGVLQESARAARVDFTWRYDLTPFGEATKLRFNVTDNPFSEPERLDKRDLSEGPRACSAQLSLYDDGWRITGASGQLPE